MMFDGLLGERVRLAWRHIMAKGWRKTGVAPWGYQWRPRTEAERHESAPASVLEVRPDEAPFVRETFERLVAGASLHAVATWAALLPQVARGGRIMPYAEIRKVLKNDVYAADRAARWPAIIDRDLWERAQTALSARRGSPRITSGNYLLTGLIRCPRCGNKMYGQLRRAHANAYRCHGKSDGAAAPDIHCCKHVLLAPVDAATLVAVREMVEGGLACSPRVRRRVHAWWEQRRRAGEESGTLSRIAVLERACVTGQAHLADAAVRLVKREIDREAYDLARARIIADVEAATLELARLRATPAHVALPSLAEALQAVGGWGTALASGDVARQRAVLSCVLTRVDPIRERRGVYTVRLTWTRQGEDLRALLEVARYVS